MTSVVVLTSLAIVNDAPQPSKIMNKSEGNSLCACLMLRLPASVPLFEIKKIFQSFCESVQIRARATMTYTF